MRFAAIRIDLDGWGGGIHNLISTPEYPPNIYIYIYILHGVHLDVHNN